MIGVLIISLRAVTADFVLTYGVWERKSVYLPIQVSLPAVHKEIYKACCDVCFSMVSYRGQFKFEPHPHWSPLGV